jgi:hypothetical protein
LTSTHRSETDYGGEDASFHAPRPLHYSSSLVQPWLQVLETHVPQPIFFGWNQPSTSVRCPTSRASSPHPDSPHIPASSGGSFLSTQRHRLRLSTLNAARMDSPSRRWVRWMAQVRMKDSIIPAIVFSSLLVRWLVGLGGYSGGTSASFGNPLYLSSNV